MHAGEFKYTVAAQAYQLACMAEVVLARKVLTTHVVGDSCASALVYAPEPTVSGASHSIVDAGRPSNMKEPYYCHLSLGMAPSALVYPH